MTSYILRRLGISILTLFIVFTFTFILMNAVPGGPFQSEKMTAEMKAVLEKKYGLDKPVYVQYFKYLENAFKGDLGESIYQPGRKVSTIIKEKFPVSMRVGLIAIIISLLVGTLIGIIAAIRRSKWQDNAVMLLATIGIAVPSFVLATVGMIVFSVFLKWLPATGLSTPQAYIMPSVAMSLFSLSFIARITRSSMLDVINQDYIRTAKAKGLKSSIVIIKHALRNAILPVVTYMGPLIAEILVGSFVIEKIFTIPGLGQFFVNSISHRDYPVIIGTTVFFAALLIFMNLLVDIAYVFVDPRIKLKAKAN